MRGSVSISPFFVLLAKFIRFIAFSSKAELSVLKKEW